MELHKKIHKGSIVYFKSFLDKSILYEVDDIFRNLNGEIMICLIRVNKHNSLLGNSEYYNSERFNLLFEFSITDILKQL